MATEVIDIPYFREMMAYSERGISVGGNDLLQSLFLQAARVVLCPLQISEMELAQKRADHIVFLIRSLRSCLTALVIVFFARAFRQHRYTLLQYFHSQAVMKIAIRIRHAPYTDKTHGFCECFLLKIDGINSTSACCSVLPDGTRVDPLGYFSQTEI